MTQTRREFLGAASMTAIAAAAGGFSAAADRPTKDDISLALWSLNRSFFFGNRWKLLDIPKIVRTEFNINGLELVNSFFENPRMSYLKQLKKNGDNYGMTFVLIMVDDEGDMIALDRTDRIQAAVAHRKWVDIAHMLGCHAIRCNLGGKSSRTAWKNDKDIPSRASESFNNLLEYAKGSNLNILIENHGGASSDPDVLVSVMKAINNPNFGTLPDFGNINPGDVHADVIRKIVPYAKGISVKAVWEPDGTHPGWDIEKIIRICQDAGYHGFWGIESEKREPRRRDPGAPQPTPEQIWEEEVKDIRRTQAVLERTVTRKA